MKTILLIIIITIFGGKLIAQSNTDSSAFYFELKQYGKVINYCIKVNELYKLDKFGFDLFSKKDYENSLIFFLKSHETNIGFYNDLNYKSLLDIIGYNYQQLKDYKNAAKYFEKSYLINIKTYGVHDESNINCISNVIVNYNELNNFKKQCEYYEKLIVIQEYKLGQDNPTYLISLNNLAYLYNLDGNYSKAELIFNRVLNIRKETVGENHPDYGISLNNLAVLYKNMGLYLKAEPLQIKALSIQRKVLGEEHPDYAISLNNLAALYREMSNYSKAEPLYIQALEVQKKVLGEEHPDYATSLSNLASLYADMSNYTKAKSLFIQALKIQKKVLGEEHPDYALSVNNLAKLYSDLGNYIEAEPLYIKALAIKKKSLGEEHPDFALSINNLASLYGKMGNYSKAEDLLIQALSIRKNALGEDNLDYAISLNNLTLFYTNMGIYEKAEPLQIKALSIQRRVLGEEHPDYAISLNNLAVLYKNMGLYLKAEPLQIKALSIQRKVLGEEHPDYAISLNNLAALYREMSNYSKAEPLYIQALEVQKKVLGEEHPDYATSLFNFGVLYADVSNYPKAEPLFIQALAIQKKVLGEEHPDYAVSLNNLALLYNDMGRIDKAKPLYSKALSIRKKYWQNNFSFLNRQELTQFVENNLPNQEIPLSFLSRNINNEIKNQLADFNLFIKNAMLFNNQLLDEIANKSKNPIVAVSWQQFIGLRLNISRLLQLPLNQQLHLRELQNQSDSIEKELMRNLPEFQQMVINNNLNWKDVQNKLKANEATIDFVSFHYSNKQLTNTIKYAAFISRPSWDGPQFINLFNEEQLASLFDSSNTSYSINKLYCNYNGIGDSSCTSELYKLIWQPMDSLLSGVKKVYVSPSGLLHRVSFSAIPIPEGGRLIDRYSLEMLANIRTLAEIHKEESDIPISFTLIGGVDYDAEPTVFNPQKNKLIKDTLFSSLRSLHRGRWSFLAGTEDEIMDIKKIIAPLNLSLDLITSSNASEEVIKMIGKPNRPVPSVIHIATHGFAFTKPKAISQPIKFQWQEERGALFRNSEDPLTRAGLVMAGGNRIWTTGFPFLNREDGILTASEVSELNLKGCLLATLSACETGLGEIKGGEGIFGLQRAFKMAGVHYLIVSLWKVPDSQTKEFMALFYSAWLIQKLTIREAFRKTQIMMSKKYSPYQWGAFILVE